MKKLFAVLVMLGLAGSAEAGVNVVAGQPLGRAKLVDVMGGVYIPDTTARWLRMTDESLLMISDGDRDRDFSTLKNLGISGVQLTAGQSFTAQQAYFLGQFSRGSLMVTYAHPTAADSDTVILAIYVYGMRSLTDAAPHLMTAYVPPPSGGVLAVGDSCVDNSVANDSTAAVGHCLREVPTFVVLRDPRRLTATFLSQTAGARQGIRKLPIYAYRIGGVTGTMLNLESNTGTPFSFPYILVKVANLHPYANGTLTNIEVNFWPRVF